MSETLLQESVFPPGARILRQDESPASLTILLEGSARLFLAEEEGQYAGEAAFLTRPGEILDASLLCGLKTAPLCLEAGETGSRIAFLSGPDAIFASTCSVPADLLPEDLSRELSAQRLACALTPVRLFNSLAQAFWRQAHLLRQQTAIQLTLDRTVRHFRSESENLLRVLDRQERNGLLSGLVMRSASSGAGLHHLLPPAPAIDLERLLSRHTDIEKTRQEGRRFLFSDGQRLAWGKNLPVGIYALTQGEVETVLSGIVIDRSGKDSFCGLFHCWPGKGREMFEDDIFIRTCGDTELQFICSSWDELHALVSNSVPLQRALVGVVAERYCNLLYLSALLGRRLLSQCDLLDSENCSCAAFFRAADRMAGHATSSATATLRTENILRIARQIRHELQNIRTDY